MRAATLTDAATLAEYLRREKETFDEVKREIESKLPPEEKRLANRYSRRARSPPTASRREPQPDVRAGPRTGPRRSPAGPRAHRFALQRPRPRGDLPRRGFYALALRMPGHGTVPGALTEATWEDWLAAVRLGAVTSGRRSGRRLRSISSGIRTAALWFFPMLSMPSRIRSSEARPARPRLPMIGVTPAARLARAISLLGGLTYFEKAKWTDVLPEYNPYKYNSFPANAGRQTWELTARLRAQLQRLAAAGRPARSRRS